MSIKWQVGTLVALGTTLAVFSLAPAASMAQSIDEIVPTEVEVGKEFVDNFKANAKIGATLNFTNNHNFVGQLDGNAVNIGANVDTGYTLIRKGHDWRAQLKLMLSFAYGPPLNRLQKATDQFYFDTLYFYHPKGYEWIGPFARFTLDTSMLDGVSNTVEKNDYVLEGAAAGDSPIKSATDRFTLTKAFSPITFKEAAGIYARPVSKPEIEVIFTFGFGASQVAMAGSQYTIASAVPGTVTVRKLEPYEQVGLAGGLNLKGTYEKKIKMIYSAFCEFMVPFYPDPPTGKGYGDLTNVDIGANLTFKLYKWATLDYVLKVVRQPQLVADWQIQNMLMLTLGYTWDYDENQKKAAAAEAAKAEAEAAKNAEAAAAAPAQAPAAPEAPAAEPPAEAPAAEPPAEAPAA